MTEDQFIQIGLVIKPHGLRGEVCVEYFADSPSLLQETVWLKQGKGPVTECAVLGTRKHKGRELLLLDNCTDRDAAEALRGTKVYLPKEMLPELSEDEIYVHMLEGLTVLDDAGTPIGTIEDFQFNGESEVWVIRTPQKKEVLFPATQEFVSNIDVDAGTVTITPPPGLLELYLSAE